MGLFEIESMWEKLWATIYALTNLIFRISSTVYLVIYFEIFALPFFILVLVVNYIVLMKHNETNREWNSTISSLMVSFVFPICISQDPERFQIHNEVENGTNRPNTPDHNEMGVKKRISFWMAICSNPVLFLGDVSVYLCLNYSNYVHDNLWTNSQLSQFFLYFLLPMFFFTILANFSLANILEEGATTNTFWEKVLACASLIGVIAVSVLFGVFVDKLTRTSLLYVSKQNELTIIEVVGKGSFGKCDNGTIIKCNNLIFNNSNYRMVNMKHGVAYVDSHPTVMIDISLINNNSTTFYDITKLQYWKTEAPEELKNSAYCKRCIDESPICNRMLRRIHDTEDCKGVVCIFQT
jgi:hypothetical protein